MGFVLWLLSCSLLRLLGRSIFQYWAAFPWRPWRSVSGLIPQGDSTQSARGSKGGRGLVQYWQGTTDKRVVSPKGESIFELFCLSRPLGTYNPSKEKLRDRQTSKVKPHGYQLQSLVYLESDLSKAGSINTIFRTYLRVISSASEGIYQNIRGTTGGPFEYTCDNHPTQQREKTSEYYKTSFSIPGQCFLELPLPDSDVLDTWDDIHRVDTQAE